MGQSDSQICRPQSRKKGLDVRFQSQPLGDAITSLGNRLQLDLKIICYLFV